MADDCDAVVLESEEADGGGREQHPDQRYRRAWKQPAGGQQEQQHGHSERQRRSVHVAEAPSERSQLSHERIAVDRDASQLPDLPHDHDDGNTGQVAHEHRLGQEVGEKAESSRPPRDADRADDDAERGGEGGVAEGITDRERCEGGRGHERGRGLRSDRQLGR